MSLTATYIIVGWGSADRSHDCILRGGVRVAITVATRGASLGSVSAGGLAGGALEHVGGGVDTPCERCTRFLDHGPSSS